MFNQIKTSSANKEVVALLSRKLGFGAENIIARMAISYSLSKEVKLDLNDILDNGGKEYSKNVLFGEFYDVYLGLLCTHYEIYKTDKDIPRYFKMHLDHGLTILNDEINQLSNIDGFDFLIEKISNGLAECN
jgi:DNA sulfur modification protein DndE